MSKTPREIEEAILRKRWPYLKNFDEEFKSGKIYNIDDITFINDDILKATGIPRSYLLL